MRFQAPWYWFLGDIVLDSLDHTFIFGQQAGGDIMAMVLAVIPLAWTGWQVIRRRLGWQKICLAMAIGIGAIMVQGVYVLVRLDEVTIISKAVAFRRLSIAGGFALSTCGALIYLQARSQMGKVTGLLVITSVSWTSMVLGLVLVGGFNAFVFVLEGGPALYNYSLGLLPACSFLFTFTLSGLALWCISALIRRSSHLCGKRV
jgi:hypothetical protein